MRRPRRRSQYPMGVPRGALRRSREAAWALIVEVAGRSEHTACAAMHHSVVSRACRSILFTQAIPIDKLSTKRVCSMDASENVIERMGEESASRSAMFVSAVSAFAFAHPTILTNPDGTECAMEEQTKSGDSSCDAGTKHSSRRGAFHLRLLHFLGTS